MGRDLSWSAGGVHIMNCLASYRLVETLNQKGKPTAATLVVSELHVVMRLRVEVIPSIFHVFVFYSALTNICSKLFNGAEELDQKGKGC